MYINWYKDIEILLAMLTLANQLGPERSIGSGFVCGFWIVIESGSESSFETKHDTCGQMVRQSLS